MAKQAAAVRLLAATNNQIGDLFTRLCGDLFFAFGYDDLRYDVAKSGRELDLQGTHRLEPRRVIAECKARQDKSGGDELNKFFGSVSRERDRDKSSTVTAYFVSLSGFTETARTQEAETSDAQRLVLLDGRQVVDELIRIRVIVDQAAALERAGRCAQAAGLSEPVTTQDDVELLGHELGYVWAVYYSLHKRRTHFALIHADGNALGASVAHAVIAADKDSGGTLHQLQYLPPSPTAADRAQRKQEAEQQYRRWVVTEFGEIQLDGLPADADLAALRIRLERLFVPLRLSRTWTEQGDDGPKQRKWTGPVGEFLAKHSRFALLAKPGGGKSTLLKRLAVAYAEADAGRLTESNDGLPPRDWLPLLVRCRELKERAERPIRELLEGLPKHAGLSKVELSLFGETLDDALRTGRVLLLVDGLDEISNEGALKSFVNNLRTFLAMFPQVAFVVTSRETGYRHVAGVVASICTQTTLAPFDRSDVRRLCESWHVHVVKDTETVRRESQELATKIWENERIRALAENPLMLTTLLVVRRSIGDLPTKRVELYRETVKVFIRTWNTQGFEPMDLEETQAQLSYVACAMLQDGVQQIGRRRLLESLKAARQELESELAFTKISPDDFIDRVEYRSSLLMQTGHEVLEGAMQPVYEFRHLTFQEYLAARGFVEEQYPGRAAASPLAELFGPHFEDGRWKEVIPLAAVLAGRKADPLIRRLTEICERRELEAGYTTEKDVTAPPVVLLRQCLLDEVQASPTTLRGALRQMGRHGDEDSLADSVIGLRKGRFGELFQEELESAFLGRREVLSTDSNTTTGIGDVSLPSTLELKSGWDQYAFAFKDVSPAAAFDGAEVEWSERLYHKLREWLASGDRFARARAAFVCVELAYAAQSHDSKLPEECQRAFLDLRDGGSELAPIVSLVGLLTSGDPPLQLATAWALVWMGRSRLPPQPPTPDVLLVLQGLWRFGAARELRRFSAWAFSEQPLLPRDAIPTNAWGDCDQWFETDAAADSNNGRTYECARTVLAWYRRRPWSDGELVDRIRKQVRNGERTPTQQELLEALGAAESKPDE